MSSFSWSPLQQLPVPVYATAADFPTTANSGELAIANDTGFLYEFHLGSWVIIAGSGAILTVGTIDSTSPSANGAVILANSLIMQSASATVPGLVNLTTQSFAGNKTFTGTISASNLSGTNTGDVTLTAVGAVSNANGASLVGQALTLQPANTSFPGVLTATDWNTFNNKQPAGSYITSLTGDATALGPGSAALTLATVNSNVGSFTYASLTVNAKGLITTASNGTAPVTTIGAVGSSPNANAGVITGNTLNLQPVNASFPGVLTAAQFVTLTNKVPLIWETNTIFYAQATYATLQAAVDAAELLAGSAITNLTGVTIILPDGDYSAQSIIIRKNINLIGQGRSSTVIGTVTYRSTDSSHSPQRCEINNLTANNLAVYSETAAASGVFDTGMFLETSTTGLFIIESSIETSVASDRINKIVFRNTYISGTQTHNLSELVQFDSCNIGSIVWNTNDAATNLPIGYTGGNLNFKLSYITNVTLNKTGGSIEAYFLSHNSFFSGVTRTGDTLINIQGGSIREFADSGVNNTVSDFDVYAPYTPALSGNWASAPQFLGLGLDQLASDRIRQLAVVGASPNANGASISGNTLTLQPANATNPGVVTTASQTLAGAKTFSTAPILSSLTASTALVLDGSKNIASLAYASANTALALVQRDGSGNFSAGTITAALTGTASGNTTISGQTNHGVVVASAGNSMTSTAAGSSGQPLLSAGASADPAYGTLGISFGGTGQVTKAAAFDALSPMTTGGDLIYGGASGTGTRLANGSSGQFLKSNGTTTAPSWATVTAAVIAPTIQKFTSGSGTYTTPAGVVYIKVRMVGPGGGGGGTNASTNGGGGSAATTFGTTLLSAGAGSGAGTGGASTGGAGGTSSLGTGPIGTALTGAAGGSSSGVGAIGVGGTGGSSPLGGAGPGGFPSGAAGGTAAANTGSGGGGAGPGAAYISGPGGGAGGYVEALISTPSATYSYVVGAGGAGGVGGNSGGAGAAGYIEVTEYY